MSNPVINQIEVDGELYDIATQYTQDYIDNAYINGMGQLVIEVSSGTTDAEGLSF